MPRDRGETRPHAPRGRQREPLALVRDQVPAVRHTGRTDRPSRAAPPCWRCRVETSVIGREFSRAWGPGALVDLNDVLAPGVRVRDVVDLSHFEEI